MSAASSKPPLAVDMDGTLLKTDMFFESLASALFKKPVHALAALMGAIRGRARVKAAMAELGPVEVDTLPLRPDLVEFLRKERAAGRPVHLVTAADEGLARRVAAHVGLFDGVFGSKGGLNLKGSRKRDFLKRTFPEGYTYAGDSPADISVWREAASVVIAGASADTARRAESLGRPIEQRFDIGGAGVRDWLKALRLHQWAKNILVFAPLLLAQAYADPAAILRTIAAFVCLGLVASGSYVLNDLGDLAADRAHRTKRNRPFASGRLKVAHGLAIGPALIGLGLGLSLLVNVGLTTALATYLALTMAYSLRLKRTALLDAVVLAGLFTLRLGIGAAAAQVAFSPWLLTFSMLFFLSLSLAKRLVEIQAKLSDGLIGPIPGRGYETRDGPLVQGLGLSTAVASVVILVLYIVEDAYPAELYAHPSFLWGTPVIVGLWVMRIWLLATRDKLDDDPVAFAVRDPISVVLGFLAAACFIAASVMVSPWVSAVF